MLPLSLNTFAHLIFIITIFCTLSIELILVKERIEPKTIKTLRATDGIYGLAAILVVTTGLLNWFVFGKGSGYYNHNSLFLIKVSLFIIVGLLSIYPTIRFAKANKKHKKLPSEEVLLPHASRIRKFIITELIIMVFIPLFAELMANGIDL